MKNTKNRKLKPLNTTFIDVPGHDVTHWVGQYLLAAMVLAAWDKKLGAPKRVGKVGKLKTLKNGDGILPFEAQWDD